MPRKPYKKAKPKKAKKIENFIFAWRMRPGMEMTQDKLAEIARVDVSTISKIESGDREGRPSTFKKLAKALNCPNGWSDLLHPPSASQAAPPRDKSLDSELNALNPDDRAAAVRMIRGLQRKDQ